jgi:hypothetical protein
MNEWQPEWSLRERLKRHSVMTSALGNMGGGGHPTAAPPPPMENEIKEKHTDILDTMISVVLRDLAFNQNPSVKSANDCYIGISKEN